MAKTARPTKHGDAWRIRWIDAAGVRKSEIHGTFDDAELALARHKVEAKERRRGLRPAEPEAHTFADLAEAWLRERAWKRSLKTDRILLRVHLEPFFGGRQLASIEPSTVEAFKRSKADASTANLNHMLTLLGSMLRLAVELKWITEVPRIRKPKGAQKPFRYLRTQAEVQAFLAAAREEKERDAGVPAFVIYSLAIYSGLRCGELCGLRWADVDLERRLITVQRSYEGTTKSTKVRHVPILDPLLPVLREWRLRNPLPLVCPNGEGKMMRRDSRPFRETLQRVLVRAGLPKNHISAHGFRHTFASHWMMAGGSIYKLQRCLGHASLKMTEIYSHLTPSAFESDYGLLGGSEAQGKVIQIRRDG